MIIGVHGFKQAGKDTFASLLVAEFGFRRAAFADRVKEAIAVIFGVPRDTLFGNEAAKNSLSPVRWEELRAINRPERAHPEYLTVRELMQIFATEICREHLPGIWFRYLPLDPHEKIVVSDLRFADEAAHLRKAGAVLIGVERPGIRGSAHASEAGLSPAELDFILRNDSSLEDFRHRGRELCARLGLTPT